MFKLGTLGIAGIADVQAALSAQGYTIARAANLERLDANVSTRAAPGAQMDLNAQAEAKVEVSFQAALSAQGYSASRAAALDNLDASVATRATPADVSSEMDARGVTAARLTKLDLVATKSSASDSLAAGANAAGLTVALDTTGVAGQARGIIEVRYSCGAAAAFVAEGSDDSVTWYEGDSFSENGAVSDKIGGYLNTFRYFRFRSPTVGIDLSIAIQALT